MPNLLLDLTVDRVDLVDEGANSAAHIQLYKNKGGKANMEINEVLALLKPEHKSIIESALAKAKTCDTEEELKEKMKQTEADKKSVEDKLKTTEEDLAKAKKELAELKKSKESEVKEEDVLKSLDPSVQDIFKSMKAQKELAEKMVREMNIQKAKEAAIAKAKDLKALPVEQDKLVAVLQKGVDKDTLAILETVAKAYESSDIFKSVGAGGTNSNNATSSTDAWDKIEAKAGEIAKARNISKQKAVGVVIEENPELYKTYLEGGAN